jgi:uncharacterized protein (DUF2236 family)
MSVVYQRRERPFVGERSLPSSSVAVGDSAMRAFDHVMSSVLGDDSRLLDEPIGDLGLLGPDSVSWQVCADLPAVILGGLSATLTGCLYPRDVHALFDHSDFWDVPYTKLGRTLKFLMITIYGSTPAAMRMLEWADRKHDGVEGALPDGTRYAARDPKSITWIHVLAMGSMLRAFQRYRRRLSRADTDQYWAELAFIPEHLGSVTDVPRSQAEAAAWLRGIRPELVVSDKGEQMLRMMLRPFAPSHPFGLATPRLRRTLGVVAWPVVHAAIGLMPPWARQMLGLRQVRAMDVAVVRPAAFLLFAAARAAIGTPMPVRRARVRLTGHPTAVRLAA